MLSCAHENNQKVFLRFLFFNLVQYRIKYYVFRENKNLRTIQSIYVYNYLKIVFLVQLTILVTNYQPMSPVYSNRNRFKYLQLQNSFLSLSHVKDFTRVHKL